MANTENNSFIKLQESANGRVSVKLQKNHFSKDGTENFFGKVERVTFSAQNILDAMASEIPLVDLGTVTSVLNCYTNTVLKVLSNGNAVKFGELGLFYIAGKGAVENDKTKPNLTVKFSPSQTLRDAVQNVEISSVSLNKFEGEITKIQDITTGNTDGTLTLKGSVLLEGTGLKVGGENSGIYFAPLNEDKNVLTEAEWIKVETTLVFNQPSKLLFSIPESVINGSYKIVIRTHIFGRSNYARKELLEVISDVVTVA
ncbi:DUF4469 domain-containing protein [Treponema berlinense]|uniref:DUF4469 domain-containing protein n=1 Tax=Treponema berlinense TaxID=225004 RepID=UPI003FD8933A